MVSQGVKVVQNYDALNAVAAEYGELSDCAKVCLCDESVTQFVRVVAESSFVNVFPFLILKNMQKMDHASKKI